MVENYGETVQDRQIPNPVRTFGEAYADFRKSLSFLKGILREPHEWHIYDLYLYMYITKLTCTSVSSSITCM